MKPLIKWVISGQGKMDYFDSIGNTLLPDGSSTYCFDCYYHIDQILADGGASYGGSYDWQGYASRGYSLGPDDGADLENELCRIYGNCAASMYTFYFDDTRTVGEGTQSRVVYRNYLQTFDRLHSLDQRFMFVHFFLQELSQKMTVVGSNSEDSEFHIPIRTYVEGKDQPYWYRMNLTGDIPYRDFMHGLSKVQQGNPQPEDYPAMMTLVEKVMDGDRLLTNDELNALIQNL